MQERMNGFRKKIVVLDHESVRGIDRSVWRALQETGEFDVTVVVPEVWREYGVLLKAEGEGSPLHVIPLPTLGDYRAHRYMFRGLGPLLERLSPAVLFVNAEPENVLACQALLLRWRGRMSCPIVLTTWRNIDHSRVGMPYKLSCFYSLLERLSLPHIDRLVAHNADAVSLFSRYGYNKTTLIPPALDMNAFAVPRPGREQTGKPLHFGFAGRFIPEKGGVDLLQAFAQMKLRDSRLSMLGAGGCETAWKSLAQSLGVSDRVRWVSGVSHQEAINIISELDVLVLPSRTGKYWKEQFGRVLIEAMALGVAVVGSDSGEIPAVIGDAGVVFPEGDVGALASVLDRIDVNVPLLREKGYERVRRLYSLEAVVPQYADMFRSCLAESERKHRDGTIDSH